MAVVSSDPLVYIETLFVFALAFAAHRSESALQKQVVQLPKRVPCGVYAGLFFVSTIFFSLASAALAGSFGALINLLTTAPLVFASMRAILGVVERVAVARSMDGVSRFIASLRGLLILLVAPWFVYLIDHPYVTPGIDLQSHIDSLPSVVGSLLFVALPLGIQVVLFRGDVSRFMFARGVLTTIATVSASAGILDDLMDSYRVQSALTALIGAGLAVVPPVSMWQSGFAFAGSTVAVGATLMSLGSPLFPIDTVTLFQYGVLLASCALLLWKRSTVRDDQTIIGAATFLAVILATRMSAAVTSEFMGELNVVGFSLSGFAGLAALYGSYVLLAPPVSLPMAPAAPGDTTASV